VEGGGPGHAIESSFSAKEPGRAILPGLILSQTHGKCTLKME
jgi:hypothetical protein